MTAPVWAGSIMAVCEGAAVLGLMAAGASRRGERRAWLGIAVAIAVLGLQRGLDWQLSALLLVKRIAHAGGWYDGRRSAQVLVLVLLAAAGLVCVRLARGRRRWSGPCRSATLAVAIAGLFTLANVVSLHGWDVLIDHPVAGVRPWAAVELGCAGVVAACAATTIRR